MGARECRDIKLANPPWRWLVVIAALPGVIAVFQLGRLHPDEVYQYLEPANWRAFGYGILAWEWQGAGLRNWAIPGIFALLLKACAAVGIDDPWKRRAVLELPQFALHLWMLWAAWQIALRRVPPELARWAIPLVGLYMPVLTFAGRTLGESFSAAFLVIGLELIDRAKAGNATSWELGNLRARAALAGGFVLGLAVVARYGSAAAVIGAMVWLLVRRRFSDFALAAAGGLVVALALGALDWVTWGAPFHSLRAYLDFNVFSGKAAQQFGSDPFTVYLPYLAMLAPWAWLGFLKRLERSLQRRRPDLPGRNRHHRAQRAALHLPGAGDAQRRGGRGGARADHEAGPRADRGGLPREPRLLLLRLAAQARAARAVPADGACLAPGDRLLLDPRRGVGRRRLLLAGQEPALVHVRLSQRLEVPAVDGRPALQPRRDLRQPRRRRAAGGRLQAARGRRPREAVRALTD